MWSKFDNVTLALEISQIHMKTPVFYQKKKKTPTQVLSCEFCEIFKNTFFYRTSQGEC